MMAIPVSRKADWGRLFLALAPFVFMFGPAVAHDNTSRVSIAIWGVILAVWGIRWGALPRKLSPDGSTAKPNYLWAIAVLVSWTVAAFVVFPMFSSGRTLRWELQSGVTAFAGIVILAIALTWRRRGRSIILPLLVAFVAFGFSVLTGYTGWSQARREAVAAEDFQSFLAKINSGEIPDIAPLSEDPLASEVALHVTKTCYLTTAKLGQEFRSTSVQSSIDEIVENQDSSGAIEPLQALVSKERAALQSLDAEVRRTSKSCAEKIKQVEVEPEISEAINLGLLRTYRATRTAIAERLAYLDEMTLPSD